MIINKKSWHYRLIKYLDRGSIFGINSSCDYVKTLIKLIITVSILSVVTLVGLVVFGAVWVYLILQFFTDVGDMNALVSASAGINAAFASLVALYGINRFLEWVDENRRSERRNSPGIAKQAYKNFKDKICTPIEFID